MRVSIAPSPQRAQTTLTWMRARLGGDADKLNIVFVSVDPESDTPEQIGRYLTLFDTPIIGLTGTPAQIAATARAYAVYYQRVPLDGGGYLQPDKAVMNAERSCSDQDSSGARSKVRSSQVRVGRAIWRPVRALAASSRMASRVTAVDADAMSSMLRALWSITFGSSDCSAARMAGYARIGSPAV